MTVPLDHPDWSNPENGTEIYADVLVAFSVAPTVVAGTFDLSRYNSYTLWTTDASFNGAQFDISDPDSGDLLWSLTTPPDVLGVTAGPVRAPVITKRIRITNNGTETLHISLSVSSRPSTFPPAAFSIIDSDNLTRASAAVAGTVNLGYGHGFGAAFCMLGVSGAVVLGTFAIRSGPDVFDIADTAEMHTNPFGGRSVYRELVVPRGLWALEFHTQTGGTAALNAHLTYVG